ncbi:MAG: Ig-like domain-containing protein [Patescibacteria group bacterium]|jgi:hypothetical protein
MSQKGYRFIISFLILFSSLLFINKTLANNLPDRNHSSLSVSSSVPADGQTTAIVTVTLKDSSGNPIVGDSVTLSDPNNSGATITSISATTDSSGHALFSIKSTKDQTDSLNVTDTTSNTTFSSLGQITFTKSSTITPTGCQDPTPGNAPKLESAIGNGINQIKLTWKAATNPVTRYLVSYGVSSGKYIYGNPNVGGQGTTTYTVGSLSQNTKYYFVVQAANGCSSGSVSNEVSSTTSLPIPTQKPSITITGNQKNVISTIVPTKINVRPSDSPTPSIDIKPTTILPIPAQIPRPGISNAKILYFVASFIVIIITGVFIRRIF